MHEHEGIGETHRPSIFIIGSYADAEAGSRRKRLVKLLMHQQVLIGNLKDEIKKIKKIKKINNE